MARDRPDFQEIVSMDEREIDIFLEEKTLGVLSLSKDDEPYGIPLCYVHDSDTDVLYFNLGTHEDSKKIRFIESNPRGSFTVFDRENQGSIRSVVVSGPVSAIEDEEDYRLARDLLIRRTATAPLYFWGVASKDLDFQFYKLVIEEKHGRDTDITWPESIQQEIREMLR